MAGKLDALPSLVPSSRKEWRAWLSKNGAKQTALWLWIAKKGAAVEGVAYADAVEEALCYGWIDGLTKKGDSDRFKVLFSKRKPNSTWSASNKERVARLIRARKMTKAGMAAIQIAKENGSWDNLTKIDALEMPEDLQKELKKNKKAQKFFEGFPPSAKKIILSWIATARTDATRTKRIAETVSLAAENIRANQ